MAISELRYGKEDDNGIPVEFVDDFPKDKIIIALNPKICKAYIIHKYDNQDVSLKPLCKGCGYQQVLPAKTIFKDKDLKLYQLNHLGEFKDLPNIGYYD